LTPNELVLTFRGSYVCANFGDNRSRNATVRVLADGQTDRQTQTDFIICPMLYAIAMGQIIILSSMADVLISKLRDENARAECTWGKLLTRTEGDSVMLTTYHIP